MWHFGKWLKLLLTMLAPHVRAQVRVLADSVLIQFPANPPGRAVGVRIMASDNHVGDPDRFLT